MTKWSWTRSVGLAPCGVSFTSVDEEDRLQTELHHLEVCAACRQLEASAVQFLDLLMLEVGVSFVADLIRRGSSFDGALDQLRRRAPPPGTMAQVSLAGAQAVYGPRFEAELDIVLNGAHIREVFHVVNREGLIAEYAGVIRAAMDAAPHLRLVSETETAELDSEANDLPPPCAPASFLAVVDSRIDLRDERPRQAGLVFAELGRRAAALGLPTLAASFASLETLRVELSPASAAMAILILSAASVERRATDERAREMYALACAIERPHGVPFDDPMGDASAGTAWAAASGYLEAHGAQAEADRLFAEALTLAGVDA